MSVLSTFAWPIQIVGFAVLLFATAHTPGRMFIMLGYILTSSLLVRYIRKNTA
jgi:hypothetical protein